MKIGTIWCKLWGHKFLFKGYIPKDQINLAYGDRIKSTVKMGFCVRCGITREELK